MCLGFPAQANPSLPTCCCGTQANPLGSLCLSLLIFQIGATEGPCPQGAVQVQPDPAPRTSSQRLAVCVLGGRVQNASSRSHCPDVCKPRSWRSLGLRFQARVGATKNGQGLGSALIPQAAITNHTSRSPVFSCLWPSPSRTLVALPRMPSFPCLYQTRSPSAFRPRSCLLQKGFPAAQPHRPASTQVPTHDALHVSPSMERPPPASASTPYRVPFSWTPGLF